MATSREQKEQEEKKDAGGRPVEKKKRKRDKKLQNAVREQMEFYFSDANLHRDRFLKKEMEKEKEGWINLSVILSFNKMKQLTSDPKMVVKSLRNSELLQVNAEKTKVRRTKPLAEPVQMDERTVYVECLPRTVTHEWIKTTFSVCGKVVYISLPRYKTTGDSKGFAFIEFEKQEEAEKACKMLNNPPDHMAGKMGVFPKTRKGRPLPAPTTPQTTTEPPSASDDTSTTPKSEKKKRKRKRKMDKDKAEEENTAEGDGQTGTGEEEAPCKRKREESVSESESVEKKPKLQVKSKEKADKTEKTKDVTSESELPEKKPKVQVKSKEKAEKTKDVTSESESAEKKPKLQVKSKEKADKTEKTKDATFQKEVKEKEDTKRDSSNPETRETDEGKDRGTDEERRVHAAVSALIKEARGEGRKRRATDPGEAPSTEETHTTKKVKPSAKDRGEEGTVSDSEVSTKERKGKRKLESVLSQETHSKRSRVEGHKESGEVKKNKRKRKKKHREERRRDREPKKRKEDVRLRVIPKKEWLKLKNRYLAMQKANMSNLKKSLVAWNSSHQNGQAAKEGKQPAEADKTKVERKAPEFVEGVVVKVVPEEPLESRQKLRDQLLPCGDIAYLDIQVGTREGYVRFKTPSGAQKAAEKYSEITTLKGEEEKTYWDKVTADWEKKFQSPNQKEKKKRKKIRGTKKLLERAEKAAALQRQHIHFDGD